VGTTDPDEIIERLGLQRHPEGGWYRETHRPVATDGARPPGTAIYCLWREGERSHWHRVIDADEVWHLYAGDPFVLHLWDGGDVIEDRVLGLDLDAGQEPQIVVPAGVWQSGETTGRFSLGGCTVALGFVWESFELAAEGWEPELG
jgi:hypothetical protein